MLDRLGKAKLLARRHLARRGGERLGPPPEHPVECVQGIVGLAEPPRQRPPRNPGKIADGLEPQPFERSRCSCGQPQRGNGQRSEEGSDSFPLALPEKATRRSRAG